MSDCLQRVTLFYIRRQGLINLTSSLLWHCRSQVSLIWESSHEFQTCPLGSRVRSCLKKIFTSCRFYCGTSMLDVECSLFQGRVPLQKIKQLSLLKVFVWLGSTFTGLEAEHSSWRKNVCLVSKYFHRSRTWTLISPGRKSNAFEKVPFLETKNVPRLMYWGHNKTDTS